MSNIDLAGRVCVVTGASQGLGMTMAEGLAAAGARVTIASPDVDNLNRVAARIGKERCLAVVSDITKKEDCARIVERTLDVYGDLAVLVNNARYSIPKANRSLLEADPDFWERAVHVNIFGTFLMTHHALPHLLKRKSGRIVNITTSLDTMQRARYSPYGVTKAAMEVEAQIWSKDLDGTGITVNSIIPGGACETGRNREQGPSREGSVLLPMSVMIPPVVWLASDHSDGETGGRYVGKLWDERLPPREAARRAREPSVLRSADEAS